MSMLNSFYSMFDFLPPSNPPPPSTSAIDVPQDKLVIVEKEEKGKGRERSSSRSLKGGLRRISSAILSKGKDKERAKEDGKGDSEGDGSSAGESSQRPKTSGDTSGRTSLTTNGTQKTRNSKEIPFNEWSAVKLVEQYDPEDQETVSQPYAYVADYVINVKLCASITEEIAKHQAKQEAEQAAISGTTSPVDGNTDGTRSPAGSLEQERRTKRFNWIEKLKGGLQPDAEVGWFVVVCGDEERAVPEAGSFSHVGESIEEEREAEGRSEQPKIVEPPKTADLQKTPTPPRKGLRRFFSKQNLRA